MPDSLPGLDRLISVLKKHGLGVDSKPPNPQAPRAGDLVLGEPCDPQLAEVYARFGGGRFGDFILLDAEGSDESLVSVNQELRRGRERLEPRIQKLLCYGKEWDFLYFFATVPSLAGAGGIQPVVYLMDYDEMPILPIASSVDRAFDLWAHFCEFCLDEYGALGALDDVQHVFPWGQITRIAQDRELVRLLEERSFEEFFTPYDQTREFVEKVLAAARG